MSHYATWKEEQEYLEKIKETNPALFSTPKNYDTDLLEHIGIVPDPTLPVGYIKYTPFDFIVEEILRKDLLISTTETITDADEPGKTVYADLVKIGISTVDAARQITGTLGTEIISMSYAGIKDATALTSQRITFRSVKKEDVEKINLAQMELSNIHTGKGTIERGALYGNRFTLCVRTNGSIDEKKFAENVEKIKSKGCMNYYGSQRFGSPRFISNVYGRLLLQGNYEELIKAILILQSEFEWPYVTSIRALAWQNYGKWEKMKEIFSELPNTFRTEMIILDELMKKGCTREVCLSILLMFPDQLDLWAKAYGSGIINEMMTLADADNVILPKKLPLLLNTDRDADSLYFPFLQRDQTTLFRKALNEIKVIRQGANSFIDTYIIPENLVYKIEKDIVIIAFDLPKGAYATTVLGSIFQVTSGPIAPSWASKEFKDSKIILGRGSIAEVYEKFKKYIQTQYSTK